MFLQIFYYLPAILGVLFIAIGAYHGWKFRGMTRRCKVAAVGTLLGFEEKKMKSGTLYYPVVRFQTQDGKTYQARYAFGDAEWDYTAGDELDLRYNPADPQEIYLDHVQSVWQQYASPFFIIIGGLIFIAAYYFIL
ncbi:MAG: DUF3592 domain-containing protein [Megasphaera elsdenii]|uniref:DUF3592 domain-containing protein n=1 Tax=Megasphaera elsdenii TaxID=907 RepID=UPI00242B0AAC|nr:DUF3592 domain-containing protein [Megasphaera elsdenii]MCI7049276.1 DUF3592 domain-containing protein [Megasphaera elsdenii]MDY5382265.1 DUF3592 domain-containing protein [Megasphaera elsdenii]